MLSQDGTLSIQEVSYEDAGEYMCVGAVPSVPRLTAQANVSLTVKGNALALARTYSKYNTMTTCSADPVKHAYEKNRVFPLLLVQ